MYGFTSCQNVEAVLVWVQPGGDEQLKSVQRLRGDILDYCTVKCCSYVILCGITIWGREHRIRIIDAVVSRAYLFGVIKLVSSISEFVLLL